MKVVLSTLPKEGEFINWTTPKNLFYFYKKSDVKYMPLGILSLATNIEDICDVKVLDPESEGWSIRKTIKMINKEKPDIVGLSAISQRTYALKIMLKKLKCYIIVGGPYTTHYAEQILEQGANAILVGQLADNEFKELIENYLDNKPQTNITYCKTKINEIKFPNRHFIDIDKYIYKGKVLFKANNRMTMFSSIGCPFNCVFCDVQTKKQQLKKPKAIVDEMEYLKSLGAESIHIFDDNFNVNEEHVNKILDEMEMRKLKIEWSSRGRANMSDKLAKRLAKNGFKRIHVGFEALNDDILSFLNKNLTIKEIERFCKTMNKHKIDMLGYFIVGTPIESEKYLKELPNKIKKLGIKHAWFNVLFPAPNTKYYRSLLMNEIYDKDYWVEYFENPTKNYKIPYPYGKKKHKKIIKYIKKVLEELK